MITWKQKDGVCEIQLATPPCNEIGTMTVDALEKFLKEFQPEQTHAVVLYSSLPSGFCAGADLRELYRELVQRKGRDNRAEMRTFLDRIHSVMDQLDMLPVTTIGVVNGVCFGGGLELALTCDLLVAEKSARFCFPELRLGIIPGFGGIPRLKRDVSNSVVRDLLMTGRSLNAQKAQAVGLVSQLVAPGEGLAVARSIATQVGKFDPQARRVAKAFMKTLPREELAREKDLFLELFNRPTVVEALKKFVESSDVQPYLP